MSVHRRMDWTTRDADGEIGNESAVHHVHMEVVGIGNPPDIPFQIDKIGGEDGR